MSRCIRLSSLFSHNKLVSLQTQTMRSLVASLDRDYGNFVSVRLVFFSRKRFIFIGMMTMCQVPPSASAHTRRCLCLDTKTQSDSLFGSYRPAEREEKSKYEVNKESYLLEIRITNGQTKRAHKTQNRRREIEKMKNASNSAFGIP